VTTNGLICIVAIKSLCVIVLFVYMWQCASGQSARLL